MYGDDLESWMWAEAMRRQERADRIQRQFVHRLRKQASKQWEPAVDIFETANAVHVIVALPGVSDSNLTDLEISGDRLYIGGNRGVPVPQGDSLLHRLEIPHGHFERRVILPWPKLAISRHEFVHGCLYLTLAKR